MNTIHFVTNRHANILNNSERQACRLFFSSCTVSFCKLRVLFSPAKPLFPPQAFRNLPTEWPEGRHTGTGLPSSGHRFAPRRAQEHPQGGRPALPAGTCPDTDKRKERSSGLPMSATSTTARKRLPARTEKSPTATPTNMTPTATSSTQTPDV